MAWITPKTNWLPTDYFNASDYNRIVGNILHLKSLVDEIFPDFDIGEMETTKTYASMFYANEMNAIEDNLELINLYTYELGIGDKQTYRSNNATPLFSEFNRIESATLRLYNRITAQIEDNTAPTITITSDYGDWATSEYYTVQGNVQPNGNGISDVYIYYTEYGKDKKIQLQLGQSGEFELLIRLMPGTNKFIVRARDLDENPAFTVFEKYSDVTAPKVTITSSTNNIVRSTYTLTGIVTDTESGVASVTINGEPVTLSDGTFSKTFSSLTSGVNTFAIVATDNVGNISITNVSITRTNDKNDSTKNWTKRKTVTSGNKYYYQVMSNGTYTNVQLREHNSGSSWDTASISGSVSVTLPKGLSSARIPCGWYGSSSSGTGTISVKVQDTTTGEILFSGSASSPNSSSVVVNLSFTEEQAMHDIVLKVSGNASGREYQGASASIGLGIVYYGFEPNWTFTYYD